MKLNSYIIQAWLWLSFLFWIGAGQSLMGQISLPYTEGFESAGPTTTFTANTPSINGVPEWSFETQAGGRLRFTAGPGYPNTGTQAATLDRDPSGTVVINYLIGTLDLSTYAGSSDLEFSFYYMDHGEEGNPNDRVWIRGADTLPWIEVYDLFAPNPPLGTQIFVSGIDVDSFLLANSQTPSATFQIRFGQEDNFPSTTLTASDGFTFDDISLTGSLPIPDNAGIASIDAPVSPAIPGINNVEASIFNFGTNAITTVTVNWEVNGAVQTPFTFTGNLAPTTNSGSQLLGTFNFPNGFSDVKVWTSNPNGNVDLDNGNDTMEMSILACNPLSGTYTLGGATADYADFSEAAFALNNCGIGGPVVINVNPGTYIDPVEFQAVIGASATNTITFDGGGTAQVTLASSAGSTPAVYLNGADWFVFRNMTIEHQATTDAYAAQLNNGADNNTFDSVLFKLPIGSTDAAGLVASSSFTTRFGSGNNANNTLVTKCIFERGSNGVQYYGDFSGFNVGNRVDSSVFTGQLDDCIYAIYQDSLEIIGNNVSTDEFDTFVEGMDLNDISNFKVNANFIISNDVGIDFDDGNDVSTPTANSELINNMVIALNDGAIELDDVEATNVYHNSVNGNPGMLINDYPNVDIRNNIFTSASGLAVDFTDEVTSTTGAILAFNIYNSGGADLADDGTNSYTDLFSWVTASPTINDGSQEGDPGFISAVNDLHAIGLLPFGAGDPSLDIFTDIDGESRPLGINPGVEIGADEYILNVNDAGIDAFNSPFLGFAPGVSNVEVAVRNFGLVDLDSVQINVEINGVLQPNLNYTTPIAIGSVNSNILTGTFNFPAGVNTLKAWTSLPNGIADEDNSNDTLEITICTGLAGVYTLGGAAADYPTFAEAIDDLLECGASANVTFQVNPGTYNTNLFLTAYPNAGPNTTVTFDGLDSTTTRITYVTPNDSPTVWIRGGDWYRFQNMTIENTGTDDAWCVVLNDTADHNSFDAIHFKLPPGSGDVAGIAASSSLSFATGSGINANYTTVSNSYFANGIRGVSFQGDFSTFNIGNTVENCIFRDHTGEGIYIFYQDTLALLGNDIATDSTDTFVEGMDISDVSNFRINGNRIYSNDKGIEFDDGNDQDIPTQNSEIYNNMVISPNDNGFDIDDTEYTNFYHNSVVANIGMFINDYEGCQIRNNIFYGINAEALDLSDDVSGTTGAFVDNNLYFTENGSDLVDDGFTGYTDLASWQAAAPAINASSFEGDPIFVDSRSDLHVEGFLAYDSGSDTLGVTVDIDGETRPLPPSTGFDIGADEFDLPQNDAGAVSVAAPNPPFGPSLQNIEVSIQNFGALAVDSVRLDVIVGGTALPQVIYSTTLAQGVLSPGIPVGSFNFPAGNTPLVAYTSLPNGVTDEKFENDTLMVNICTGLDGTYTVGGTGADYANFNEAVFDLNNCGVIGPVVFNVAPGTYNENIFLEEIPGASAANTVSFIGSGADSTTITFVSAEDTPTVYLFGTDWISFSNLTIENTGTNDAWAVMLQNSANNNSFDSVSFRLGGAGDAGGLVASGSLTSRFTPGQNASHTTVSNCTFENGDAGVSFYAESDSFAVGNRVTNSSFSNIQDDGILLFYQDSVDIIGNTIVMDLSSSFQEGMDFSDISNFRINGNAVGSADRGIEIDDANDEITTTNPSEVINNMVIAPTDDGFDLDDFEEVNFFHNSVIGSPGILINDYPDVDIRNNIFYSPDGLAADFLDEVGSASALNVTLDYNIYFTGGTGDLVDDGFNSYTDLASWQAAATSINANSLQGDPIFVDPFGDLHLLGGLAENSGDNSVMVMMDIDGETRPQAPSTTVDIGADEYTALTDNATPLSIFLPPAVPACGDSMQELSVIIRNLGTDSISNFPIDAELTGDISGSLGTVYTDTLPPFQLDTVSLGTYNTALGGNYSISVTTSLPGDQDVSDDTLATQTYTALPIVPTGLMDTVSICLADTAVLQANAFPGANYAWYDSLVGGNQVGAGEFFTVPSIAAQNTYYVGYLSVVGDITSFVAFSGGNGQSGNMFDVTALSNNIIIDSLDIHINGTSTETVEVYFTDQPGGFTANATDPTAWTLAGTQTVTGNGAGNPTRINGFTPFTIPAGQTYGVYVTLTTSTNISYTNGNAGDFDANNDIRVDYGFGLAYPFGISFSVRVWNGTIYYGGPACSEDRNPVTAVSQKLPAASFTTADSQLTITITDAASDSDSVSYEYGDGTTGADAVHTYALPGTYTVCQIAYNECGTDTACAQVSVSCPAAVAGFGLVEDTSTLVFVSSVAVGADSIRYDWGDGTSQLADTQGNASHFYQTTGTYTICQIAYSVCGNDTICDTTSFLIRTGLEIPGLSEVDIYPNPNKGNFNIQLKLAEMKDLKVEVTDIRGKRVFYQDYGKTIGDFRESVELNEVGSGMYFLKLRFNDQTMTRKLRVE